MTKQVFVPITDELLEKHPELIAGSLTPFQADVECHHWLIDENPGTASVEPTELLTPEWLETVRRRLKNNDPGVKRQPRGQASGSLSRQTKLVPV